MLFMLFSVFIAFMLFWLAIFDVSMLWLSTPLELAPLAPLSAAPLNVAIAMLALQPASGVLRALLPEPLWLPAALLAGAAEFMGSLLVGGGSIAIMFDWMEAAFPAPPPIAAPPLKPFALLGVAAEWLLLARLFARFKPAPLTTAAAAAANAAFGGVAACARV